jgi:uncharacterized protein YxeA
LKATGSPKNYGRKRKSLKDSTLIILAIVLILVIGGGFSLPKIDLANFNPFAGFGGTDTTSARAPLEDRSNKGA